MSTTVVNLGFIGKVLEGTIQESGPLKITNELRDFIDALDRADLTHADGLCLPIIVAQNQFGNIIGHCDQQLVAFFARHAFLLGDIAQQDLDIDFTVRTVDAP